MPLTPAGVPWALGFCATGGGGAGILRGLCGQPTMPAPPLAGRAPGPLRGGRRGHGPLRAPGWRWWPGPARRGRTRRRSRVATTGRRVRGTCRGGEGPPPEDSWAPVEKALTFAPPRLMIAPMRPGRYLDAPGPRRRGLRGHEARGGCQFCRKGGSRSGRPVGRWGGHVGASANFCRFSGAGAGRRGPAGKVRALPPAGAIDVSGMTRGSPRLRRSDSGWAPQDSPAPPPARPGRRWT